MIRNVTSYIVHCKLYIVRGTVLYCTVLYCTVLYCTVLYCTVLYCTVLYCTVLYCTVLYSALLCSALLCSALLYSTLLYSTLLYSTLLYISSDVDGTVWYISAMNMLLTLQALRTTIVGLINLLNLCYWERSEYWINQILGLKLNKCVIFIHLKLWIAVVRHNLKGVKIYIV